MRVLGERDNDQVVFMCSGFLVTIGKRERKEERRGGRGLLV